MVETTLIRSMEPLSVITSQLRNMWRTMVWENPGVKGRLVLNDLVCSIIDKVYSIKRFKVILHIADSQNLDRHANRLGVTSAWFPWLFGYMLLYGICSAHGQGRQKWDFYFVFTEVGVMWVTIMAGVREEGDQWADFYGLWCCAEVLVHENNFEWGKRVMLWIMHTKIVHLNLNLGALRGQS